MIFYLVFIEVHGLLCNPFLNLYLKDVSTDNVNGVKTLNENGDVDMTKVNEEEKDETDLAMSHELGNLLDVMMNAMLSYIHDLCYANGEGSSLFSSIYLRNFIELTN